MRYDQQAPRINKTDLPGHTWVDTIAPEHNGYEFFSEYLGPMTIQEYSPPSFNSFSPRFSLTYDINGDGKNVIKFSAARYGSRGGTSTWFTPCFRVEGAAVRSTCIGTITATVSPPGTNSMRLNTALPMPTPITASTSDYKTGRLNARFADDYNTPLLDELTLSFEKQLAEDLAVSRHRFLQEAA